MDIDEKYFEENALVLLDSTRDLQDLESVDFARLRKSYDVLLAVDENGLETKWYFDVADCMMLENLDFSYLEKNMPEDDLEFLDGP